MDGGCAPGSPQQAGETYSWALSGAGWDGGAGSSSGDSEAGSGGAAPGAPPDGDDGSCSSSGGSSDADRDGAGVAAASPGAAPARWWSDALPAAQSPPAAGGGAGPSFSGWHAAGGGAAASEQLAALLRAAAAAEQPRRPPQLAGLQGAAVGDGDGAGGRGAGSPVELASSLSTWGSALPPVGAGHAAAGGAPQPAAFSLAGGTVAHPEGLASPQPPPPRLGSSCSSGTPAGRAGLGGAALSSSSGGPSPGGSTPVGTPLLGGAAAASPADSSGATPGSTGGSADRPRGQSAAPPALLAPHSPRPATNYHAAAPPHHGEAGAAPAHGGGGGGGPVPSPPQQALPCASPKVSMFVRQLSVSAGGSHGGSGGHAGAGAAARGHAAAYMQQLETSAGGAGAAASAGLAGRAVCRNISPRLQACHDAQAAGAWGAWAQHPQGGMARASSSGSLTSASASLSGGRGAAAPAGEGEHDAAQSAPLPRGGGGGLGAAWASPAPPRVPPSPLQQQAAELRIRRSSSSIPSPCSSPAPHAMCRGGPAQHQQQHQQQQGGLLLHLPGTPSCSAAGAASSYVPGSPGAAALFVSAGGAGQALHSYSDTNGLLLLGRPSAALLGELGEPGMDAALTGIVAGALGERTGLPSAPQQRRVLEGAGGSCGSLKALAQSALARPQQPAQHAGAAPRPPLHHGAHGHLACAAPHEPEAAAAVGGRLRRLQDDGSQPQQQQQQQQLAAAAPHPVPPKQSAPLCRSPCVSMRTVLASPAAGAGASPLPGPAFAPSPGSVSSGSSERLLVLPALGDSQPSSGGATPAAGTPLSCGPLTFGRPAGAASASSGGSGGSRPPHSGHAAMMPGGLPPPAMELLGMGLSAMALGGGGATPRHAQMSPHAGGGRPSGGSSASASPRAAAHLCAVAGHAQRAGQLVPHPPPAPPGAPLLSPRAGLPPPCPPHGGHPPAPSPAVKARLHAQHHAAGAAQGGHVYAWQPPLDAPEGVGGAPHEGARGVAQPSLQLPAGGGGDGDGGCGTPHMGWADSPPRAPLDARPSRAVADKSPSSSSAAGGAAGAGKPPAQRWACPGWAGPLVVAFGLHRGRLGYLLGCGAVGVVFEDGSRMLADSAGRWAAFHEPGTAERGDASELDAGRGGPASCKDQGAAGGHGSPLAPPGGARGGAAASARGRGSGAPTVFRLAPAAAAEGDDAGGARPSPGGVPERLARKARCLARFVACLAHGRPFRAGCQLDVTRLPFPPALAPAEPGAEAAAPAGAAHVQHFVHREGCLLLRLSDGSHQLVFTADRAVLLVDAGCGRLAYVQRGRGGGGGQGHASPLKAGRDAAAAAAPVAGVCVVPLGPRAPPPSDGALLARAAYAARVVKGLALPPGWADAGAAAAAPAASG
ncbi:hypothetical protein HT031_002250 [Scenedesmus sp. PABB004]|nr:hypothetical protein HT031_002250 [Scenedesmus sp. PABB004]